MKDTYYLFRSDKPNKKFVMVMPSHKHIHHFGSSAHRDFTLMNDRSSNPSSMSDLILWTEPTLRKGIKKYEKQFGVKVVFKDTKLTDMIKKKLLL
jgi:hypothetical protein